MRMPPSPRLEQRRQKEFESELLERARAWIPQWALTEDEPDFGRALLKIAARFNSEVAERLDRGGEKMQRGFLDWLAVRRVAARPARMPVVLKLADNAPDPVLAVAPVRMQADTEGAPVVFETETDVCLLPGQLQAVVACDGSSDAFYLPPLGLSDLKPLEPLPTQWRLKAFAAAGATKLQLDPDTGLAADMIVEAAGKQYKIIAAEKDIVTIDPPLAEGLGAGQVVNKVTTFAPFDGAAHNWQEHALYLGDADLLNIEAEAKIEVVGAKGIGEDVTWQYWAGDEKGWQPLAPAEKQTSEGVVLQKPKGAIETNKIREISSRWIRAYRKTANGDPFRTDRELGFRINSSDCDKKLTCDDTEKAPSPAAEAMANTTPLVLDTPFFPLGKEPKQFDAFYLGSQEAFSKKKAEVQLCFQMADLSFAALSNVTVDQPAPGTSILAGVGRDRFLHLLQFNPTTRTLTKFHDREPLQPPKPAFFGAAPSTPNPVVLDSQPPWRLPMWMENNPFFGPELFVGMTAGIDVWLWCEILSFPILSGWVSLGQLPAPAATGTPSRTVDGLVYLEDALAPKIAALYNGKLYLRDVSAGAQWQQVDTVDPANNPVALNCIVPVVADNGSGQLLTSVSDGMVGVSDNFGLYSVDTTGACTPLVTGFAFDSRPAAFKDSSGLTVVGVDSSDSSKLTAFQAPATTTTEDLPSHAGVVGSIHVFLSNSEAHFLASARGAGSSYLADWTPFGATTTPIESEIPPEVGQVGGAPSTLPHDVIIPGANADLLVAAFDVTQQKTESAEIKSGIVVADSTPALAINDVIAREGASPPESHLVTDSGLTQAGETFYPMDSDFSTTTGTFLAYRNSTKLSGTFPDNNDYSQFALNSSDLEATQGEWLLIGTDFYYVDSVDTTDPRLVTISPVPTTPPSPIDYVRGVATDGRVAPFMHLDPSPNGSGDWDASLLQRIKLVFPGKYPPQQNGKAFTILGNNPVIVVLGQPFDPSISGTTVTFIVNAAAGSWSRLLGDTLANPELSWEYWNGKGWWKLPITSDATSNLKNSGALEFQIPDDIAATDWSGKTNFWIRARLVGGDYGREKVTVTTTTSGNVSQQTVERSSEGIRAPQVVLLHIFYRICEPSIPTYVLTQDSGSIRDQSDANRTGGAIVEAFVPLGVMLARLSRPSAQPKTSEECLPDCSCKPEITAAQATTDTTAAVDNSPIPPDRGRSLFIGFDKPLSQQPVNVLLLVEQERDHSQFAPMKVEGLMGDRFVPIVANDTTRALGESGLLSMSFSVGPTPRELFGQSLFWLRLTPVVTDSPADWKPTLRGAYLNAVWASATETMTRELVGSSEGAPNLTLYLARPPLLEGTLELRVKEPLGEEERSALLSQDKKSVLSSVEGLPGDWVLWKQVTDPADEAPNARVYALDESTGKISFGDGQHGAIPPIGSDSIVAFSYQRTEPGVPGSTDVPANSITARTQLGLVSPVPSVEAAFAADQAAGGAPPEPDERVVRFGSARLRHRGRAVTARDLEDIALQSSPKIAQAHCIVRPSYVKLVVVMRGNTPTPNAAEVRELRRLLLAAAPAALGVSRVLRIQGADLRTLRIGLNLTIADLDYSGEVARDAKQRIKELFDVATGGIAKDGWQLGENPSDTDVAYVLSDVPRLEGIAGVEFVEITKDLKERAWPKSLKPAEIAVLSEDPVRIEFTVAEVVA